MDNNWLATNRTRGAFTIVETITAMAIILVVAAITLPVFKHVKRSGIEASARQALHQNWLALEIYRNDWGGGADHGTSEQMAMPLMGNGFEFPVKTPYKNPNTSTWGYIYYPLQSDLATPQMISQWVSYSKRCTSQSIVLADLNFNDFDPWRANSLRPKKGLGVLLGGSVVTRIREGSPSSPFWWDCREATP
jgi:type II secretory pathway pseudopilin PulG